MWPLLMLLMLLLVFIISVLFIGLRLKLRTRAATPDLQDPPDQQIDEQEQIIRALTQKRYLEIMSKVNTPRIIPELPLHRRQEIQIDNELIDRADPERREIEILIQLHDSNEEQPWVLWGHNGIRENRNNDDRQDPEHNTLLDNQGRVRVINDFQNVHDPYINRSVKQAIESIKSKTKMLLSPEECFTEIRAKVKSKLLERPRLFGLYSLFELFEEQKDIKISIPQMSEYDAIWLVWNRIHDPINDLHREDIIDNLFLELLDGKYQCEGGRFNRIIDSLNIVDPEVKIRPQWAVQREMMDKAGILRKEFISAQTQEVKDAFESLDPTDLQETLCETFNQEFKTVLIKDFTPVYVDTGIVTSDNLENEINLWVSAL